MNRPSDTAAGLRRDRADRGPAPAARSLTILGVAIDDVDTGEAIALMRAAAEGGTPRSLFIVNAHTLNLACEDDDYRRILNGGDLVFNDGTGVRLAARLQGIRLRANLNGTDLVPAFMEAADGDGLSCYLFGSTPAIVARTAAIVRRRFPGWTVAGTHHGFIDPAASAVLLDAIAAARPNVLLVAMGNPLQERWIAANLAATKAGLCIGVGGLFAYLTGDYRRAPALLRRFGLEWLAVLVLQRQKWRRYVVGNPVFLGRVLRARLRAGRR